MKDYLIKLIVILFLSSLPILFSACKKSEGSAATTTAAPPPAPPAPAPPAPAPPPPPAPACDLANLLTVSPIDIADISAIDPPGRPYGGDVKPHSYITTVAPVGGDVVLGHPVYAPTSGTISRMSYYHQVDLNANDVDQYIIWIDTGCDATIVLDHFSSMSPVLFTNIPARRNDTQPQTIPNITVNAGDLLGYVAGNGTAFRAIDFRFYDHNNLNGCENYGYYATSLANNPTESYANATCGYNYFTNGIKNSLVSLFKYNGTAYPLATCTSACRNDLGMISGKWVVSTNPGGYPSVVAIAKEIDSTTVTLSIDNYQTSFPNGTDPHVTSSDTCYTDNNKYFYFSAVTNTQANIAIGNGPCPGVFPATFGIYSR